MKVFLLSLAEYFRFLLPILIYKVTNTQKHWHKKKVFYDDNLWPEGVKNVQNYQQTNVWIYQQTVCHTFLHYLKKFCWQTNKECKYWKCLSVILGFMFLLLTIKNVKYCFRDEALLFKTKQIFSSFFFDWSFGLRSISNPYQLCYGIAIAPLNQYPKKCQKALALCNLSHSIKNI